MPKRAILGFLALLCVSAGPAWSRDARQVRMKWGELGSRLPPGKISLMLPDGTHVEGKAVAVQRDGLLLHVTKTSNRAVQPKGDHLIPQGSISVLRVTEHRARGRLLGLIAGAGIAGGIAAASYPDLYEGTVLIVVPAVTAAGVIGAAIGGYYAGKALDTQITEIMIEPEARPPEP